MIAGLLMASLAASGAQDGCADHWRVELNQESFANNGASWTFSPADLEAFRTKLQDQFKSAIADACRNGSVTVAKAKAIQRVEVSSASGASEPFLYPTGDGMLRFEWIFAEESLAIPPAKDIVEGAVCWTDPNGAACIGPGD
jgi:hypothetical protein